MHQRARGWREETRDETRPGASPWHRGTNKSTATSRPCRRALNVCMPLRVWRRGCYRSTGGVGDACLPACLPARPGVRRGAGNGRGGGQTAGTSGQISPHSTVRACSALHGEKSERSGTRGGVFVDLRMDGWMDATEAACMRVNAMNTARSNHQCHQHVHHGPVCRSGSGTRAPPETYNPHPVGPPWRACG